MMKAISLWQPWASLWLSPLKIHETRHWAIKHRGPLLVHAAKRAPPRIEPELEQLCIGMWGSGWALKLPRGAIVGRVDLIGVYTTEEIRAQIRTRAATTFAHPLVTLASVATEATCGDFGPDRYGWRRGDQYVQFKPLPWRGLQNVFNVPDEVVRTLEVDRE
jgi:hypothetical protein